MIIVIIPVSMARIAAVFRAVRLLIDSVVVGFSIAPCLTRIRIVSTHAARHRTAAIAVKEGQGNNPLRLLCDGELFFCLLDSEAIATAKCNHLHYC